MCNWAVLSVPNFVKHQVDSLNLEKGEESSIYIFPCFLAPVELDNSACPASFVLGRVLNIYFRKIFVEGEKLKIPPHKRNFKKRRTSQKEWQDQLTMYVCLSLSLKLMIRTKITLKDFKLKQKTTKATTWGPLSKFGICYQGNFVFSSGIFLIKP